MATTTKRVAAVAGHRVRRLHDRPEPGKAAEMVQTAFGGISTAGESLGGFFDALVS